MRVLSVREAGAGIEADIDIDGSVERVTYTSPEIAGSHYGDALLAATLIPAMSAQAALQIDMPVSRQLLDSVATVQDIIRTWEQRYPAYSRYQRVQVSAEPRAATESVSTSMPRSSATFFSAGVDSFYTALRHESEVQSLVFVQGFDFALRDEQTKRHVTHQVSAAAQALGKKLIVVATDLREFADRYTDWDQYHGAALASVGLLLSAHTERIFIPATHTYAHLTPLGSHPLLDPLWGTEELRFVHDGLEASRLQKLAAISTHPAVRAHLHVCTRNQAGSLNCGKCEKCLRTMLGLLALDSLPQVATFPDEVDAAALRRASIPPHSYTWQATLALLDQRGGHDDLRRIVRSKLYSRSQLALGEARRLAHRAVSVVRSG